MGFDGLNTRTVPKEVLDWNLPLTDQQLKDYPPAATNLAELASLIRDAGEFIADEESSDPVPLKDPEGGWYNPFFSSDSFGWAVTTIITAKNLKASLEDVAGPTAAKELYEGLFGALRLGDSGTDTFAMISLAEYSSRPNPTNGAAESSAKLIEIWDEMIEIESNHFSDSEAFRFLVEITKDNKNKGVIPPNKSSHKTLKALLIKAARNFQKPGYERIAQSISYKKGLVYSSIDRSKIRFPPTRKKTGKK